MAARYRNWFWLGLAALAAAVLLLRPQEPPKIAQVDSPVEVAEAQPKLLALTFDDGPRRSTTSKLLEGLDQRGVQATFFLIGKQIEGNEDLILQMAEGGHQIGVHTFDHVELKGLSRREFDLQVGRTRALISGLVGEGNYWLRPPYGLMDSEAKSWCGGPVILWSVDPEDWKELDADRVTQRILENVEDGDVILLHDIYPTSVEAAIRIVDELHRRGFLFLTVSELAREKQVELKNGEVYNSFPG